MKISVIIPALNEEAGIAAVIQQVPVGVLKNLGHEVEVLVIDNRSTDRTGEIARENGARVLVQPVRGYGNAYKLGFSNATGDIIVTGDADMTYPFDAIPELLQKLNTENLDFLNTDRLTFLKKESMTTSHVFGNWFLSMMTRILFSWPYKDSQSGMWIFKRSIWKELDVRSGGMPFSQELKIEAFAKGYKCSETPIEYRPRVGEVKLSTTKDGIRNVTHLFLKRITLMGKNKITHRA